MDQYTVRLSITPPRAQPLLVIPVKHVSQYSFRPLKWLRYVTGAVLGTEGTLSSLEEGDGDEELDLEAEEPAYRELLFTPIHAIRFIDCQGLYHLKSSLLTTESQVGFRDAIMERDGSCVLSGLGPRVCQAAHIIPHSKGDDYIQKLCCWRTGSDQSQIESIVDVRNGIFITATHHVLFADGILAILRTPNFAMSIEDASPGPTQENLSLRFTPHYFIPEDEQDGHYDTYTQDLRHPPLNEGWPQDWPPAFIWDFVYGVVIARKYGVQKTLSTLSQQSKGHYYPEGHQTFTERAHAKLAQQKEEYNRKVEDQKKARDERVAKRGNQNHTDAFDQVFDLWMYHRYGPLGQKTRAEDEAKMLEQEQEQHKVTEEKVMKWREEVQQITN